MNAKMMLKSQIKENVEKVRSLRKRIADLKWKAGRDEVVVQRDSTNKRLTGKKAFKAFRRPETGPERHALWFELRHACSYETRRMHLCLGLLRGRLYATMEAKTNDPVQAWELVHVLKKVLSEDQMVDYSEEVVKAWLEGSPAPTPKGPPGTDSTETSAPPSPPPATPSFAARLLANLELLSFRWLQSCSL